MSQRKGLADLFEAMKILKKEPVQLSILGQPSMPMEFYYKQYQDFKYYEPCPNSKVQKIMQQHDVLVLPFNYRRSSFVQQEALSCGLPIIVTRHAGAEDLIINGINGHIVPIRSPEKIAEAIYSMKANGKNKDEVQKLCQEKSL